MKATLFILAFAGIAFGQPAGLKFPPLGKIPKPEIQVTVLPNGMKVYLMENRNLPLVSGSALVRTGSWLEPREKFGVASLTGEIMRGGGTKSQTGDQIDEQLENIAASVETSISDSEGVVRFSALKENTDQVLAIFKDVLLNPEFRQDKIDLLKNQLRGTIARRNDEAEAIAGREFEETVYGRDTIFGRRMEYENVDALSRADLLAFHARYFFPANTILIVSGDFTAAEMKTKLEALFADWAPKGDPPPPYPKVDKSKIKPGIYVANKDNVQQTFFEIGHLGGLLRDKDYPAMQVANSILGESFSGRLFNIVRTAKGYAYNIGSSWGAGFLNPGLFHISGSASMNHTTDTLEIVQQEIGKLRKEEVTAAELDSAKSRVINSFVFKFDHPSKTLTRLVNYSFYGYPDDYLESYQRAIAAVTKAEVLAAARKYLEPEKLVYVVVGNTAEFGRPLTDLKLPVKQIDLTIPEPKKSGGKADAASAAKAKQILVKAQAALGGVEALEAIKDMVWTVDMSMQGAALQSKNYWIIPGLLRQEQSLPIGRVVIYSDGNSGWMKTQQGEMPMPEPVLKQVQEQLMSNLTSLVLSDRNATRTVTLVDDATVEIAEPGLTPLRLTIDPANGLPTKIAYKMQSPQGMQDVVQEFQDYRAVGPIRVSYRQKINQAGRISDSVSSNVRINTGLTKETISAKP